MDRGTLFVVATPIGNLDDLAPRARKTLGAVDLVAAEDTRVTGRLLSHFGLKTRQIALHDHNEEKALAEVLAAVEAGHDVALVSDAGTPLVSDPGFRLLRRAHELGVRVSPVPGPSAVTAALSVSGIGTDRFCFEGFLPAKSAARLKQLERLRDEPRTLVFFEAVHRIADTLDDLGQVFGAAREAFLGRELTKLHEQCRRGTLGSLADELEAGSIASRGEFVIVVAGSPERQTRPAVDADALLDALAGILPGSQAVELVAALSGQKRNALYRRMLKKNGDD